MWGSQQHGLGGETIHKETESENNAADHSLIEQFRTTESYAWAFCLNSYSLARTFYQTALSEPHTYRADATCPTAYNGPHSENIT